MLQAQLFAKSGKQLKEITFSKVQKLEADGSRCHFSIEMFLKTAKVHE